MQPRRAFGKPGSIAAHNVYYGCHRMASHGRAWQGPVLPVSCPVPRSESTPLQGRGKQSKGIALTPTFGEGLLACCSHSGEQSQCEL